MVLALEIHRPRLAILYAWNNGDDSVFSVFIYWSASMSPALSDYLL